MDFSSAIHRPQARLRSPLSLQLPDAHPSAPMSRAAAASAPPEIAEIADRDRALVFDPFAPVAAPPRDALQFSADFECGNVGRIFRIGDRAYEIHLIPDPGAQRTCQWFLFRAANVSRGAYCFVVTGFYRQCNLHHCGSQICAFSEQQSRRGVGWFRVGRDMSYFRRSGGARPEWALSFTFTANENDTMYFAHSYPYTYTDLVGCLASLGPLCRPSVLCRSCGGVDVPAVLWDADEQRCVDVHSILESVGDAVHQPPEIRDEHVSEFPQCTVDLLKRWGRGDLEDGVAHSKKPVFVIAARIHPGETNSSYAVEGLLRALFADDKRGEQLRRNSWLIIPMMNPDGVICGFYRPSLGSEDMNRVWRSPDPKNDPEAYNVLNLITAIQKTHPIPFFLDFHGHTAACNSFTYGFMNDSNPDLYKSEKIFPLLMTKHTPLFSNEMCSYLKQEAYEGTMRVVLRRKFLILFAYTLEISYGGSDFGPRKDTQFSPHDFRSIGEATAISIDELFSEAAVLPSAETFKLMPFPQKAESDKSTTITSSRITIEQKPHMSEMEYFSFVADDIKATQPKEINLRLNQSI